MWIERLPSGKYRAGYRDAAGKKRQRTFLHKAAARKWAEDAEVAIARGHDPDAGRLLLREWSERWMSARVVAETTALNEVYRMAAIVAAFGDVPLERMSTMEIQGWEKRLVAGGMGTGTVRSYHKLLRSMLQDAVRERLLPDNPAAFVVLPPTPRHREVYLTPAEVDAVAGHMTPGPYDVIVRLQPYLGMRWGEIIGLRPMDLDLLRGTVQVRQVVVEVDGGVRRVRMFPKTSASFRTVPILPPQVELLAAYLAANPRGRGDLIFRTVEGRELGRDRMSLSFARALTRAGVDKDARPHDLRHSGASWMAQAGVPIVDLAKWLGHGSIQTTMRYVHATGDAHGAVRAAMGTVSRGTTVGQAKSK